MTRPLDEPDSQPGLYRQIAAARQRISRLERRPSASGGAATDLPWAFLAPTGTPQDIASDVTSDPNYIAGTMGGPGIPIQLTLMEQSSGFGVTVDGDWFVNIPAPGTFYIAAQARFDIQGYPWGYPHGTTGIAPRGGAISVEIAGSPSGSPFLAYADVPVVPLLFNDDTYWWNADQDNPRLTLNVECIAKTSGATAYVEFYLRQHGLALASVDEGTVAGDYPSSVTMADPALIVNAYTYMCIVQIASTDA